MCYKFINGSDHKVVACYLELYEEGEVEHVNSVLASFLTYLNSYVYSSFQKRSI